MFFFSLKHSSCTHHKIHSVWCASLILILTCPKLTEGCRSTANLSMKLHQSDYLQSFWLRTPPGWITVTTTDLKQETKCAQDLPENTVMSSFQLTLYNRRVMSSVSLSTNRWQRVLDTFIWMSVFMNPYNPLKMPNFCKNRLFICKMFTLRCLNIDEFICIFT